jgi:hypothetical protein
MTIDERLEALTHSVELIAQMKQTTEKQLRRLSREVRRFMRTAQLIPLDHETRLRQIEGDEEEPDNE